MRNGTFAVESAGRDVRRPEQHGHSTLPAVRRIEVTNLRDVLAKGFGDLGTRRTDVMFLCVLHTVLGVVLGRLAFGYDMLPL